MTSPARPAPSTLHHRIVSLDDFRRRYRSGELIFILGRAESGGYLTVDGDALVRGLFATGGSLSGKTTGLFLPLFLQLAFHPRTLGGLTVDVAGDFARRFTSLMPGARSGGYRDVRLGKAWGRPKGEGSPGAPRRPKMAQRLLLLADGTQCVEPKWAGADSDLGLLSAYEFSRRDLDFAVADYLDHLAVRGGAGLPPGFLLCEDVVGLPSCFRGISVQQEMVNVPAAPCMRVLGAVSLAALRDRETLGNPNGFFGRATPRVSAMAVRVWLRAADRLEAAPLVDDLSALPDGHAIVEIDGCAGRFSLVGFREMWKLLAMAESETSADAEAELRRTRESEASDRREGEALLWRPETITASVREVRGVVAEARVHVAEFSLRRVLDDTLSVSKAERLAELLRERFGPVAGGEDRYPLLQVKKLPFGSCVRPEENGLEHEDWTVCVTAGRQLLPDLRRLAACEWPAMKVDGKARGVALPWDELGAGYHDQPSMPFGPCDETIRYHFVSPWLALNQHNHEEYMAADARGRRELLERVLVGNLLSMAKAFGLRTARRVEARVGNLREVPVRLGAVKYVGLMGDVSASFVVPFYWGVGKAVDRGFGVLFPHAVERPGEAKIGERRGEDGKEVR